jgi:hypothetical protein
MKISAAPFNLPISDNRPAASQKTPGAEQVGNHSAIKTGNTVATADDDQIPPVYSRPVVAKELRSESNEERFLREQTSARAQTTAFRTMHSMKMQLGKFMEKLQVSHPELVTNKNWGFSVAEDGSLVATRNNAAGVDLTDEQQEELTALLNQDEDLVNLASRFAKTMVDALELERGSEKLSYFFGQYDVTMENFHKIIDFKKLVETESKFESEKTLFNRANGLPDAEDQTARLVEFEEQLASRAKSLFLRPLPTE